MKYVVIVGESGGYQTHTGNIENLNLPDAAEIYDEQEKFEECLGELR